MCSGSGERGNWTSQQAFQEINSILDRLGSEDLVAVPAEAMGDDQVALQRILSRVQAEALRRLRRFDGGKGYASSGALSAKAWLRWECNMLDNTASDQVNVARQLDSLPQTAQAFAAGDFSYRHAGCDMPPAWTDGHQSSALCELMGTPGELVVTVVPFDLA